MGTVQISMLFLCRAVGQRERKRGREREREREKERGIKRDVCDLL